jgi:hypothetical protein
VSHDPKVNKIKSEKGIEYTKTLTEYSLKEQLADQWVEEKLEEFERRGIGKRKASHPVKFKPKRGLVEVNGVNIILKRNEI